MEQVLNKLSEIETTANYIMEQAANKKQELTQQMEEQCRQFDGQIDAQTAKKVSEIRSQLEKDKDKELSKLRKETEETFASLDAYYAQNHDRLVQEIYHKILEG
ncbi:MAG: hypothetical protein ACOYBE_03740 [Blautia sp.]|jgi:tRNA uridine 5-carbamoylmethylation protein Kti12